LADISDWLLQQQVLTNLITLNTAQMQQADLYPVGEDGVLDISDLAVSERVLLAP